MTLKRLSDALFVLAVLLLLLAVLTSRPALYGAGGLALVASVAATVRKRRRAKARRGRLPRAGGR